MKCYTLLKKEIHNFFNPTNKSNPISTILDKPNKLRKKQHNVDNNDIN